MTSPGLGRSPNSDAELLREVVQRLRRLEEASTARLGDWTLKQDPVTGKLQAMSPDGAHDLTPDPTARPDVVAGIMPGVFSACRTFSGGTNAGSGNNRFPGSWYNEVTLTSDRIEFDEATNGALIQSTAVVLVRVSQRVASGQFGSRAFRACVWVTRAADPDPTPTLFSSGSNAYYASSEELIFADFVPVPVTAGDIIMPGYWCSDAPVGALTGDPAGVRTKFDIIRVIDL